MINKKNVLGKEPAELGDKDAIHVAIVAVRAGTPLAPGAGFKMNDYGEAVHALPEDRLGVIDPFRRDTVQKGGTVWALLDQDSVPNVRHDWDHPTTAFAKPTRDIPINEEIQRVAGLYGISYADCLAAAAQVAATFRPAPWPEGIEHRPVAWPEPRRYGGGTDYEFWSAFSEETGFQFNNEGSECCPEYVFPTCSLLAEVP